MASKSRISAPVTDGTDFLPLTPYLMSADIHLQLTNVLTPEQFFRRAVPVELRGYKIRVFQASRGSYTTLSLDKGAQLLQILGEISEKEIQSCARAIFMGLEQGYKAGAEMRDNAVCELQVALPFLLPSNDFDF